MFTPEFFEVLMVVSFGVAWPTSIMKSIKSKTAKGKSILFMVVVWFGYLFGMLSKFVGDTISYVLFFYVLNILMVSVDIALYFINKRNDRKRDLLAAECGCPE